MYLLQPVMEEEPSKGPSQNNPKEAANYVRSVNLLLKSFVTSIHGFDHYKHLDAWETFLHTLSQLLSKLDSAYFIKMDTEVILDTIPDKACDTFLACPEEAATRIQQRVSSDKIPAGPEVLSKMRLQGNLPCFDKKGQQAVTKLFGNLQNTHNHMAEVAKAIINVSEVSSPEQFTFVLQLAVRPIVQLKIPPHLSAPTELKFERERLTPEEINEENCCNLILPRPFHPKFTKLDFKDPTRCLAAAAHFLIRKKLFNSKCTQLHVAKDFAVAEKKLHFAISRRKYDPGKKASKRKHTSDVKTSDPKPSTLQDKSASEQPAQDESVSEQQPQDEPIPEQQPQDEPVPEQQQDAPATKQQDKASDTLTSLSSDESIILPDYGPALKTFTTKDPSSVPKKPRYSLHPKTEYI